MERTVTSSLRRAVCGLLALLVALAACVVFAPAAYADSDDLDEIQNYTIDVTPNTDGSLYIVATVDWLVLDSSSEGPLEWVQIGLPNEDTEDLTALTTDTIDSVYRDGSYAHIAFDRSYYEGEVVHFSYAWTQRYMYTLGEDGSVSYEYTPGWFDSAIVDNMTVVWRFGDGVTGPVGGSLKDSNISGIQASADTATESTEGDGYFQVATIAPMEHGGKITVNVVYESWPGTLDSSLSAENYSGSSYNDEEDADELFALIFFLVVMIIIFIAICAAVESSAWSGGFGSDGRRYVIVNHMYYPADLHGHPVPGSVGSRSAPAGFHAMGGGHSYGSGGGRSGGGHSCACASSCACACACAGGGRAGCSAKNLYGVIHLPDFDHKDSEN